MQRFGIEKLFPTLISSMDLQQCMPASDIYLSAVKAMNLPPADVAFVGHDRVELAGASAVGMATIAFNFDPDAQADVHLTRFEELISVLSPPTTA
jgi:FMN phosphatase YigB (HAD superfamily)